MIPKPQMKKYKKAPQAPRRFKSSYMFFSTEKHKSIRRDLAKKGEDSNKFSTTDVAKMVSQAWKELSNEEREVWEELARKDKARYEMEKSMYTGPWKVPAKRRAHKDPNAPKRPMSAFLSFSNAKRSEVKDSNPNMGTAEIARVLAQMWKNASDAEKKKHIENEFRLRQEYKVAIADWRKTSENAFEEARKAREDQAMKAVLEGRRPPVPNTNHQQEVNQHGDHDRAGDEDDHRLTNRMMPRQRFQPHPEYPVPAPYWNSPPTQHSMAPYGLPHPMFSQNPSAPFYYGYDHGHHLDHHRYLLGGDGGGIAGGRPYHQFHHDPSPSSSWWSSSNNESSHQFAFNVHSNTSLAATPVNNDGGYYNNNIATAFAPDHQLSFSEESSGGPHCHHYNSRTAGTSSAYYDQHHQHQEYYPPHQHPPHQETNGFDTSSGANSYYNATTNQQYCGGSRTLVNDATRRKEEISTEEEDVAATRTSATFEPPKNDFLG
eukprot:Nitzschia sp. Nitz4//scaffold295_size27985//9432//11102//NITZ4_008161-RA/size27985-snap-gene-0.63-mRNA-1//1//CDS//3329546245//3893//frame0